MDEHYHMRMCGGTWVYCDGACDTCVKGYIRSSNKTELAEQKILEGDLSG